MLKNIFFTILGVMLVSNQIIEAKDCSLRPIVNLSGADTMITANVYLKLESQDELKNIWLQHIGYAEAEHYDYFFNKGKVPVVDFEKYMVIAIFLSPGENCAGIQVSSILEREDNIIFDFEVKHYQNEEGKHKPGNAFGFFIVPASDKKIVVRSVVRSYLARAGKEPIQYKVVATIE